MTPLTLETRAEWEQEHHRREEARQADFEERRKTLREELLAEALATQGAPTVFQGTYDGYGDSGQSQIDSKDERVVALLDEAIDLFVTFDWYNNEGGGGDITWDIKTDKITINGYYNEVQQVSALEEAEF